MRTTITTHHLLLFCRKLPSAGISAWSALIRKSHPGSHSAGSFNSPLTSCLLLIIFAVSSGKALVAQNVSYPASHYFSGSFSDSAGKEISRFSVPGRPPSGFRAPVAERTTTAYVLNSVPAYIWSFGCAPTAAAMQAGYYDNQGYPLIYTGPSNGGVMPMDNTLWGTITINGEINSQCPLAATRQGFDGRISSGHVDDYWINYENGDPDPYITANRPHHNNDTCTGDFMGSNQSAFNNPDGSTTFYVYSDGSPLFDYSPQEPDIQDGCHGLRQFYEAMGYEVVENYTQMILGYNNNPIGFTFAQYREEIDNGRPVLIHVSGHTMLGFGYDEASQLVYMHDTWDFSLHSMTWGGIYAGRQHFAVTVIRLQSDNPPPLAAFSADLRTINPGDNVAFTDESLNTPTSWLWTFEGGDPETSTDQNPVISYSNPGIYPVSLVATNEYGYDTEIRNRYIYVNHCFASNDCIHYITGVTLAQIDTTNTDCGTNGYSDFTSLTAMLIPGKAYNITVQIDDTTTEGEQCGVWIDWNRDNDFSDPDEFTGLTAVADTNLFTAMITPPLSAEQDSLFRLRIRLIETGELSPCGPGGAGETEDYSIYVVKPVITVTPDTLNFGGIVRFHCSDAQPYTVSAKNISSPLTITASPDMSISFYPDHDFTPVLSIPQTCDTVPETTVYAKYCVYWTTGEYEHVYNSSPGAETKTVTLYGYELIPPTGNAPQTIIGDEMTMPDTTVVVPVTVRDFTDVQFGNLNLLYKSGTLSFEGITNINPEINWWFVDAYDYPVSDSITQLNLYLDGNDNPRSIPDNDTLFDLEFSYSHGGCAIGFDTLSCTWEDTWYHTMNDEPAGNYYFSGSVNPLVKTIDLELYLEGLSDSYQSSMRKAQGEYGNQFPGQIADMISIQLVEPAPPHAVAENTGLIPLMQNGSCRFQLPLEFSGEYYLVITHRNSIETWSALPLDFSPDYLNYDFTDAASKAYGNNLKPVGDRYCIFCGDVNADGNVDSGDMTLVDNDAINFVAGYVVTDVTGDGIVDTSDMTLLDNNSVQFVGRIRP